MDISFLAGYPQYAGQIAQWYFNEWGYLSPDRTVENMTESVLNKAQSQHDIPLILVAHQAEKPAGALELKYRENVSYPEYEHWIGGVYVAAEFRGKGIAGLLLDAASNHARTLGITKLYLQCEDPCIGLYQKFGFQIMHRAKHGVMETTIMSGSIM